MIRLLHLADLHLGRPFQMLGRKGAAQRRALEAALARAVDVAIAERVQLMLIAGDLFDSSKPSAAALDVVTRELRRLDDAGIRLAAVAGNHDVAPDGYIGGWERLRSACPRVIAFGHTVETVVLPELDLTIVGRSPDPGSSLSPLTDWPRGRTTRFAVGVTHGSTYRAGVVDAPGVIHPQEIRGLGLDYLALGDWHSAMEILPAPHAAWYAGSPELLAFDQEGAGHVLLIELQTPGQAVVVPHRVGRRRYHRLELDVSTTDEQTLRKAIEDAADPDTVCDVVLTGLLPVNGILSARALEEDLGEWFFRLRITNRAQLRLDDSQLGQLSAETVLGRYVRLMRARLADAPEDRRAVLEEALQVGVAVLQGKEILA